MFPTLQLKLLSPHSDIKYLLYKAPHSSIIFRSTSYNTKHRLNHSLLYFFLPPHIQLYLLPFLPPHISQPLKISPIAHHTSLCPHSQDTFEHSAPASIPANRSAAWARGPDLKAEQQALILPYSHSPSPSLSLPSQGMKTNILTSASLL